MSLGRICKKGHVGGQTFRTAYHTMYDRVEAFELVIGTLFIVVSKPTKRSNSDMWTYTRVLTQYGLLWVFSDAVGPA